MSKISSCVPGFFPLSQASRGHPQTSHHSDYGSHFVTLIMAKTQRNAYDAAFKLKAMDLAVGKGNRAAAQELGLNESIQWMRLIFRCA